MSAIRVARGFTGRDKIVKFEGCYHGHADGLLVRQAQVRPHSECRQPGVPKDYARNTLTLPYNDLQAFKKLCEKPGRASHV